MENIKEVDKESKETNEKLINIIRIRSSGAMHLSSRVYIALLSPRNSTVIYTNGIA